MNLALIISCVDETDCDWILADGSILSAAEYSRKLRDEFFIETGFDYDDYIACKLGGSESVRSWAVDQE